MSKRAWLPGVVFASMMTAVTACGSGEDSSPNTPAETATDTGVAATEDAAPIEDTSPPVDTAPTDPFANTLTLYAIPAPASLLNPEGLTWKSPGALVRRVLVNEGGRYIGFNRTIGHAGVRVDCAAAGGEAAAHYQGSMANQNSDDFNALVMDQKVGLGMLFDNVPGVLETEAELQKSIDERRETGKIAFIKFGIASNVCRDLLAYAKAYEAENVQRNYGLEARPLYREGSGCSAFSMAFLELANLIEPRFIEGWSFNVRVPLWTSPLVGSRQPLIGGSYYPMNEVPITRLTTLTRGWASPEEEGRNIFGWDPTQMYVWINQAVAKAEADGSEPVASLGVAKGLMLDRVGIEPKPALKNRTFWSK